MLFIMCESYLLSQIVNRCTARSNDGRYWTRLNVTVCYLQSVGSNHIFFDATQQPYCFVISVMEDIISTAEDTGSLKVFENFTGEAKN